MALLNTRNAVFYTNKGSALYSLGRYREALQAYEHALRLNPRLLSAQYGRDLAQRRLRRMHEARKTSWGSGSLSSFG